jgi:sarcosine/dimethylglycine N-methyltransferase
MKYKIIHGSAQTALATRRPFAPLPAPERIANLNSENSRVLAGLWDDFVNPKVRLESEGPFLLSRLAGKKKVLDSCMGTGVDSLYLAGHGYEVVGNEVDSHFRARAQENARRAGIRLRTTSHDWRELGVSIGEKKFDALICMGNSFNYLFERAEQLSALGNFLSILKEGGTLILDVRNYAQILGNREAILAGQSFPSCGRHVYCGADKVRASAVSLSEDEVVFRYSRIGTSEEGYLSMYPLMLNELRGLLSEAGFANLRLFSDYAEGYNPDAGFYQLTCTRPHSSNEF